MTTHSVGYWQRRLFRQRLGDLVTVMLTLYFLGNLVVAIQKVVVGHGTELLTIGYWQNAAWVFVGVVAFCTVVFGLVLYDIPGQARFYAAEEAAQAEEAWYREHWEELDDFTRQTYIHQQTIVTVPDPGPPVGAWYVTGSGPFG